jgi:WD40 repeat protein
MDLALPSDAFRASTATAALATVASQPSCRFLLRGNYFRHASFSPDGSRIVAAYDDNTARIWDSGTGKQITVLRGHNNNVTSAVFSPDGSRIVTASTDKTVCIWDATKEIEILRGHHGIVWSASFSPDGSRIVTASGDKTARIWDTARKEFTVLRGHDDKVTSAAFSPDGSRIVTASEDNTARIWDVHVEALSAKRLLAEACARLAGHTKLTREEMRLARLSR